MVSAAGTPVFQKEWFRFSEGYGFAKAEFQDQISAAFAEMERQSVQSYEAFSQRVRQSGRDVKLTREQKQYLAENFDPKNMSFSEYQSFIDKLCEFGILDEADKDYVSCGAAGYELEMIPLGAVQNGGYLTPGDLYNPMSYSKAFSSSKGNVLDWADYLSRLTVLDQKTTSWQKTPESILFGKIRDVLEKIS